MEKVYKVKRHHRSHPTHFKQKELRNLPLSVAIIYLLTLSPNTPFYTLLPADFLLGPVNFYHQIGKGRSGGIKVSFLFLFSLVSVALTLEVYSCLWLLLALSEPAIFYVLRDIASSQMLPLSQFHGHPSLRFSDFFSSWKYCLLRGLSSSQLNEYPSSEPLGFDNPNHFPFFHLILRVVDSSFSYHV